MKRLKPKFIEAPIAEARFWLDRPGWICQEKLDGRWAEQEIGGNTFVGEQLKTGFVPFDIPFVSGQDIRREPLAFRLDVLRDECRRLGLPQIATGYGEEFLQAVLGRGGEGVVAKERESVFGFDWVRIKRCMTLDCVVTEKHATKQSIALALDGQPVGWCACLFSRFETVAVGDVVEIACHSRHPSGRLREPRFIRRRA